MDHLTKEQIERYQLRNLGKPQDYREADAHIATCVYCRERLFRSAEEGATSQMLYHLLEGTTNSYRHPSQDVLVDVAQNQLSVPPGIAEHIRACEQCRKDIADLRGYTRGLEEAHSPKPVPSFFAVFRSRFFYGGALAVATIAILFFLVKSRPVVVINDAGGQWTLNGWGHLKGPSAFPEALQAEYAHALRDNKLEMPAILASLQGQSETLRSPSRMVILSDRPTLMWKPPANATAETEYVCTIVSISNPNFKRPPSKPIKKPSWTLPAAKPPLPRGEIYTWRVVARTNGKSTEMTGPIETLPKFKVLEQAQVTVLEDAKKSYGGSHLMMALLYTRKGLLEEAEREFAALQQANPGSREIEALQSRLNAMRHETS